MFSIEALTMAMTEYERGCPQRVQHFVKVHGFARAIGLQQGLPGGTQLVLEAAAVVHDIGIRPSLEQYGAADGPRQEAEGPPVARPMLEALGMAPQMVERVCFLIAHHHTTAGVDGPDWQILLEADFLVNIYEGEYTHEQAASVYEKVFRTEAGRRLCRLMYL